MPYRDSLHQPCACNLTCGDVPEDQDSEYAVCTGLPRASLSPLFPAPPGETAGTLDADHGSRPGQPPSKAAA